MTDAWVALARLGGPRGIRGEIRLVSYTEDPDGFAQYGVLHLLSPARSLRLLSWRCVKDRQYIVLFEGLITRQDISPLVGLEVGVPRSLLPPPGEEEFYHADLLGLEVYLIGGASVGTVVGVYNHGAGDVMEIKLHESGLLSFPFTHAFVPLIEVASGRLYIAPEAMQFFS